MAETSVSSSPIQVIDFMREQFARVHQRFDKIELVLSEYGTRLQRVEREIVGLHQGMANLHSDYAMLHRRLDNVGQRLERIERRLDLIELPHAETGAG